jgi:hypothetical protein
MATSNTTVRISEDQPRGAEHPRHHREQTDRRRQLYRPARDQRHDQIALDLLNHEDAPQGPQGQFPALANRHEQHGNCTGNRPDDRHEFRQAEYQAQRQR